MIVIADPLGHPSDPYAIAGKALSVTERCDLLVVGAGRAGLAAALEAARLGLHVILVDENPVAAGTMGDDVPLHFGQRMSGAARNGTAMLEAFIASDPLIAEAFDAGIDVRLGVAAWGLWTNSQSVGWLPGLVTGVADGRSSAMILCGQVIVATGRRDMGLAFPGWELPGVMGMEAAERLMTRYGALECGRAVVLGTTAEALAGALALAAAGVVIAAVIEALPSAVGPAHLLERIAASGIPVLCNHKVLRAEGATGVEACVVIPRSDASSAACRPQRIACDTIILGIGTVPLIELLDAAGCRTGWQSGLGGAVPASTSDGTSVPGIRAAGDCLGIWPAKSLDASIARAEGVAAARSAAAALGRAVPEGDLSGPLHPGQDTGGPGCDAYRLEWVRSTVVEGVIDGASGGGLEPHVCLCESVTARDLWEVRPPRYLQWDDHGRNRRDMNELLGCGVPHPDQVKRLTRAGMGLCQGRRCREQVAAVLALATGVALQDVPIASYRAPVRPLPLDVAGETAEDPAMTRTWDTWFGMHAQYVPFWDVPEHYTAAGRIVGGEVSSE